jgi:hypothetical protein
VTGRRLALAAVVAGAATLAGCAAHPELGTARSVTHAAWCRTPAAPAGTRVQVDASGNAWTMGTHVAGPVVVMTCAGGTWHVVAGGAR